MEKKSDMVRRLVAEGNYKKALSIVKGFRLGITKEQKSVLLRGYECMVNPRFYESIGTDIPKAIDEGVEVLITLYG